MSGSIHIFVSYSRADSRWVEKGDCGIIPWLAECLADKNVEFWFDHALKEQPGVNYRREIESQIDKADSALLLISHSFANSRFIAECELPRIRRRFERNELSIIPILVGRVAWDVADKLKWMRDLQMLPGETVPLVERAADAATWDNTRVEILQAVSHRVMALRRPAVQQATRADAAPRQEPEPLVTIEARPPPRRTARILGPRERWRPQTHPDSRAVFGVGDAGDGRTLDIRADFVPGDAALRQGEAIVLVGQGAAGAKDVTTFRLEDVTIDMRVPGGVDVSFFAKDDRWESSYWTVVKKPTSDWQNVSVRTQSIRPASRGRAFDPDRVTSVGLQFRTRSHRGPATMQVRDFRLDMLPTSLISPVRRCPLPRFIQQSGVDLAVFCAEEEADMWGSCLLHEAAAHRECFRRWFAQLADRNVPLARVGLIGDGGTGLGMSRPDNGSVETLCDDMAVIVEAAPRHPELRLLCVLFDGPLAQRWPSLVVNPEERNLLLQHVIAPFLESCTDCGQIYGIEVISDVEAIAELHGDDVAVDFARDSLAAIRRVNPEWRVALGYRSRTGLDRLNIPGYDVYTCGYDPADERNEALAIRRDSLVYPPESADVVLVANLPLVECAEGNRQAPSFASYALQDCYDYGYAGLVLNQANRDEERVPFTGSEAEAFADWISKHRPHQEA